jgi:hypothetical protein
MRLPVDTSAVNFVTAGPADPAVDFDTKAQKTEDGQPVFNVHLFALGGGSRDVITVKVTGTPKGLGEFTPVRVSGLIATTWSMGDRSGVSFKATSVEATVPPRPAS